MPASETSRASSQSRAVRPVLPACDAFDAPDRRPSRGLHQELPDRSATLPKVNGQDAGEKSDASSRANSRTNSTARDGSPRSVAGSRFLREPAAGLNPGVSRASSQSPFRLQMPSISPAQLAFSAMQYLPVPILVLNSLKTVVLANEAMGRMLGIVPEDGGGGDDVTATMEQLRGQTLSQVGIDMLQDGRPVWLTWNLFLDSLIRDMAAPADNPPNPPARPPPLEADGDATPTNKTIPPLDPRNGSPSHSSPHSVVEVVISRKGANKIGFDSRYKYGDSQYHVFAKMIISVWEVEDHQTYFTLSFTSAQSTSTLPSSKKSIARPGFLEAADRKSIAHSNTSSASSRESNSPSFLSSGLHSPGFHSPGLVSMTSSPFPPMGPPSVAAQSSAPSLLQKMILMKDALLDNTQVPIVAMWKDGSVVCPNKAARKLFKQDANVESSSDGIDLLHSWEVWDDEFTRKLDVSEYPMSTLLATETPFESLRVGMYGEDGKKIIYDVLGEAIRDDNSGEFLAGVVTARDVTLVTKEITQIKERDEERFRIICDTMPQLVWTASPDGMHDFFNTRWYSYTGLTMEESLGQGWQSAFHPDDMPISMARWHTSLQTGEPFVTEYRCRSAEGEWKWFLGRAIAVRNKETGKIENWFGTCTDVNVGIETKLSAERTRQQLRSVIALSHITIFTVDPSRRVTMLEGSLLDNNNANGDSQDRDRWYIGENMYEVFNRLTEQMPKGERPGFLQPIEDILEGKATEGVQEHGIDDRWYRTRFLPMMVEKTRDGRQAGGSLVEGVIGVVMDVTEVQVRERALQQQSKERRKAMANAAAAKEATRLKSQFLANMSHEIRTPITGVLGMAELLGVMELDEEQREYVDNIQSSATSLLTVINDILDFSKVESGRLDIEEVQFSLSLIVKEVGRMLQFAVEQKNLDFQSDIGGDIENDMVVIGDPGRVRQIITNILTNSIKFTNQGYVRFSVVKEGETDDSIEVKFTIEDTGIGIQEDVRKKLFQPFSQGDASTARRFGGTGLGLTICRNLLELMRGRITLESAIGSGTTATFWIPFHKPRGPSRDDMVQVGGAPDRLQSELGASWPSSEQEHGASMTGASDAANASSNVSWNTSLKRPPAIEQDLSPSERGKIHILVVEDNAVNQKIATRTISKLGFQVAACWNGREALDYLLGVSDGKNRKPDIILMDVQMPLIDGYKCTHLLRKHLPYKSLVHDVPIVAMTASAIQGDREKCTKAGMDDYLPKPVTMAVLEKMLVRWCLKQQKRKPVQDPTASDCSEASEYCDTAEIPHVGMEEGDFILSGQDSEDFHSPVTPRPLTANGQHEPSPFDSPSVTDLAPQVRQLEGDKEWSTKLQETKMIDAAGGGGSSGYQRSSSFLESKAGDSLTEENVNKLGSENQPPRV